MIVALVVLLVVLMWSAGWADAMGYRVCIPLYAAAVAVILAIVWSLT